MTLQETVKQMASYEIIREQLRQADREEQWSLRTGFNRMCYSCKRDCKTRNKTWTGCVKREVKDV